jgi:RNA recognition motif-containing protein
MFSSLHSFTPSRFFTHKLFAINLPKNWNSEKIALYFGKVGNVSQVSVIKNKIGEVTGKAVISYSEENEVETALKSFEKEGIFLDGHIIKLRPFFDKKGDSPRKDFDLIKKRIYLQNLPYKASKDDVITLVSEFAQVDNVILPRDPYAIFNCLVLAIQEDMDLSI